MPIQFAKCDQNGHILFRDDKCADIRLYDALWALQSVFVNPRRLGHPANVEKFEQFQANLDLIVDYFRDNQIDFASVCGLSLQQSAKYLTSPRLTVKQLNCSSFRRYICVQTLIFLSSHFVKTELAKCRKSKLSNVAELGSLRIKWMKRTKNEILKKLLPSIPPNGQKFADFIENVLECDENWLCWKYQNGQNKCAPLIIKRSLPAQFGQSKPKKRKLNKSDAKMMGDANLRNIWLWTPEPLKSKRNASSSKQKEFGLDFLREYAPKNAEKKLEEGMDCMAEFVKDGEMTVLKDKKTMFTQLRLMRDAKQRMFASLCPQAKDPHDKEFSKQFDLMRHALKYYEPNSFGADSKYFNKARQSKKDKKEKKVSIKKDVAKKSSKETKHEKIRDRKRRFQSKQRLGSASGSRRSR